MYGPTKNTWCYKEPVIELLSEELNHLAAILHVYAGGLIFIKEEKIPFWKRKYYSTFSHNCSEKSSVRANSTNHPVWPQSAGINLQSTQSDITPWILTLTSTEIWAISKNKEGKFVFFWKI